MYPLSNRGYKINHSTNYKNWNLEEIYISDKAYLYYLLHTHKTPNKIKEIIIEFLASRATLSP